MPLRGGGEEPRLGAGVGRTQAIAQQIAEEVVEPVAIGLARHRDDEHGVVLELPQERRAVVDSGDILDEPGADLIERRESEQGAPALRRLRIEHLFAEVVDREPIALGEGVHEVVGVGAEPQAEPGELDAGGPSFGPLDDRRRGRRVDRAAQDPLEHAARALGVEGELGLPQLHEPVLQPVPAPAELEVDTRGEDEVGVRRKQVDQPPEVGDDLRVRDAMQIVEDDDDLARDLGERRGQSLEQSFAESAARRAQRRAEVGQDRVERPELGEKPPGEVHGVAVGGAHVEPCHPRVVPASPPTA